jgi:glycosyltransferase involved in cell wall biosynthesis
MLSPPKRSPLRKGKGSFIQRYMVFVLFFIVLSSFGISVLFYLSSRESGPSSGTRSYFFAQSLGKLRETEKDNALHSVNSDKRGNSAAVSFSKGDGKPGADQQPLIIVVEASNEAEYLHLFLKNLEIVSASESVDIVAVYLLDIHPRDFSQAIDLLLLLRDYPVVKYVEGESYGSLLANVVEENADKAQDLTVVTLSDRSILNAISLRALVQTVIDTPNALHGCLLAHDDGIVHTAGLDVDTIELDDGHLGCEPFHRFQGLTVLHPVVQPPSSTVLAVDLQCAATQLSLLQAHLSFFRRQSQASRAALSVQLSLQLADSGRKVSYTGSAVTATYSGQSREAVEDKDSWGLAWTFLGEYSPAEHAAWWGQTLRGQAACAARMEVLTRSDITIMWDGECGGGQVLGFTSEAVAFVQALAFQYRTLFRTSTYGSTSLSVGVSASMWANLKALNALPSCLRELHAAGFPASLIGTLRRRQSGSHNLPTIVSASSNQSTLIHVLHRDPGRYASFARASPGKELLATQQLLLIGRSMYETATLPADWPEPIGKWVESVWVPSLFNQQTFQSATGLNASHFPVLWEPMDLDLFVPLPGVTKGDLSVMPHFLRQHLHGSQWPHLSTFPNQKAATATSTATLTDNDDNLPFAVLAVGKWEVRKNWRVLVEAFCQAFGVEPTGAEATPAHVLYLRTHPSQKGRNELATWLRDAGNCSNVQVLDDFIPQAYLPHLYRSVDLLLSTSHGEGWGRPLVEAMACGCAVASPAWSGESTFIREDTAWVIPHAGLELQTGQSPQRWANITVAATVQVLQTAVTDIKGKTAVYRRRVTAARHWVEQSLSLETIGRDVAQLVTTKLQALAAHPESRRLKSWPVDPTSSSFYYSRYASSSATSAQSQSASSSGGRKYSWMRDAAPTSSFKNAESSHARPRVSVTIR